MKYIFLLLVFIFFSSCSRGGIYPEDSPYPDINSAVSLHTIAVEQQKQTVLMDSILQQLKARK
jgi:hypothetical protein